MRRGGTPVLQGVLRLRAMNEINGKRRKGVFGVGSMRTGQGRQDFTSTPLI